MASRILQLSQWMINKADQMGLTLDQCKALTREQIKKNLPEQYREHLTQVIFLKAKLMLIKHKYQQMLNELKENTNIRQEILNVFPNATFRINKLRKQIIISLEGE